jgi:ketosteroid isomerase-like protein
MRRLSRQQRTINPLCRKTGTRAKPHKGVTTVAASQNIEISKKGFAAFDAGDVDAVLNDYDDDIEFVVPGNSTVSGTYRGKDRVKELFGKVAEQNFKLAPIRFLADDDVVVVLSQVSAGGESGLQADEFTYRNGKIVKAQNFGDTGLFEQVFGRK